MRRVNWSTYIVYVYTAEIQMCASLDLLTFVENSMKRPINEKWEHHFVMAETLEKAID